MVFNCRVFVIKSIVGGTPIHDDQNIQAGKGVLINGMNACVIISILNHIQARFPQQTRNKLQTIHLFGDRKGVLFCLGQTCYNFCMTITEI